MHIQNTAPLLRGGLLAGNEQSIGQKKAGATAAPSTTGLFSREANRSSTLERAGHLLAAIGKGLLGAGAAAAITLLTLGLVSAIWAYKMEDKMTEYYIPIFFLGLTGLGPIISAIRMAAGNDFNKFWTGDKKAKMELIESRIDWFD